MSRSLIPIHHVWLSSRMPTRVSNPSMIASMELSIFDNPKMPEGTNITDWILKGQVRTESTKTAGSSKDFSHGGETGLWQKSTCERFRKLCSWGPICFLVCFLACMFQWDPGTHFFESSATYLRLRNFEYVWNHFPTFSRKIETLLVLGVALLGTTQHKHLHCRPSRGNRCPETNCLLQRDWCNLLLVVVDTTQTGKPVFFAHFFRGPKPMKLWPRWTPCRPSSVSEESQDLWGQ